MEHSKNKKNCRQKMQITYLQEIVAVTSLSKVFVLSTNGRECIEM